MLACEEPQTINEALLSLFLVAIKLACLHGMCPRNGFPVLQQLIIIIWEMYETVSVGPMQYLHMLAAGDN